jgi:translation initiation factor IF-3
LRYPNRNFNRDEKRYIFGRFIREQNVYCIDHNNNNLGIIETREALSLASQVGLELVMVSPGKNGNPSICKILDFGKFKYEQERRDRLTKKKQRDNAIKIKEIKLRPSTGYNDLMTKVRQLSDFLNEGNRLKVTMIFKGREMCHRDVGLDTIAKFASMFPAKFDGDPMVSGKNITVMFIKSDNNNTESITK